MSNNKWDGKKKEIVFSPDNKLVFKSSSNKQQSDSSQVSYSRQQPDFMESSQFKKVVEEKQYIVDTPEFQKTLEKFNNFSGGTKFDIGKAGMDLLPYDALIEVAKVLDFGAKKYTAGNWSKGIELRRLLSAGLRHIGEFNEGRDIDPESGLNHIAHAACNMLFILWMLKHHPELDNRWIKETK